jgi:Tfp pilus assembly protein PilN
MRPVNLIPPEARRDAAAARTGPVAYQLVGALAVALAAVMMLVLTNNKISDRQEKIDSLRQQEATARADAARYAAFEQFAQVEQERTDTIHSLADSRFDWERVLQELARVMPADVWLLNLTGTVSPSVSLGSGAGAGSGTIDTSSISGPSLQISGCAAGQDAVARFIAALRDIDGVTRVGLASSDLPDQAGSSDSGNAADCQVRDFLAKFQIVAAFDAVPTPPVAGAAPAAGATPAPSTSGTTTPSAPASDTTYPGS